MTNDQQGQNGGISIEQAIHIAQKAFNPPIEEIRISDSPPSRLCLNGATLHFLYLIK